MWVKICGITRRNDALAAVRLGADAIGFVLTASPRRIDPSHAQAWIHEIHGIEKVGVFTDEDPAAIISLATALGLDTIQLHATPTPAHAALARSFNIIEAVKEIPPHLPPLFPPSGGKRANRGAGLMRIDSFDPHQSRSAFGPLSPDGERGVGDRGDPFYRLMIDASRGRGVRGKWEPHGFPFILAGGLTPENVREAVFQARPVGVDVSSGVEVAPGIKDALQMERFIKEARA